MANRKKYAFLLAVFTAFAGLVLYAYATAPPQIQKDECDDHEHEQTTVLNGEIGQINQETAKSITIQLEELSNEDCANQIAGSLAKLGGIGKIKCDMTTKRFEVQYDPNNVSEEHILTAFNEAKHPGKIATES